MSTFYCPKKKCRKSAWATPEYLTEEDWKYAEGVAAILASNTANAPDRLYEWFWEHNRAEITRRFFDQTIGWPEGYRYEQSREYNRGMFAGLKRHELPKLAKAIKEHRK